MLFILLKLSPVHLFSNRSKTNCEQSSCYSQTLLDPFLSRTTEPRCPPEQADCIATFLLPLIAGQSNEKYLNTILVCGKLNSVDEITLSLNLNGHISDSSLSFSFTLYKCLDCLAVSVERTDSWKENDQVCSTFRFPINRLYHKNKEILYINRVGYYLTVRTRSNGVLHQARTKSFAYPQSPDVQRQTVRPCEEEKTCLFFRGQNVSEQCVKKNDCTGRVMIHRPDKLNDRLVSIFGRDSEEPSSVRL